MPPIPPTKHLIFYDGVCGLCDRVCQFVLKHDTHAVFDFAAIQKSPGHDMLTDLGVDPTRLDTVYVLPNYHDRTHRLLDRAEAALFIAAHLPAPYRWLSWFRILPWSLLNWAYRIIANSRYRWFGTHPVCAMLPPQHRARFLDQDPSTPSPPDS